MAVTFWTDHSTSMPVPDASLRQRTGRCGRKYWIDGGAVAFGVFGRIEPLESPAQSPSTRAPSGCVTLHSYQPVVIAPVRFAPVKLVEKSVAPVRFACLRDAPVKLAAPSCALTSFAFERSALRRSACSGPTR